MRRMFLANVDGGSSLSIAAMFPWRHTVSPGRVPILLPSLLPGLLSGLLLTMSTLTRGDDVSVKLTAEDVPGADSVDHERDGLLTRALEVFRTTSTPSDAKTTSDVPHQGPTPRTSASVVGPATTTDKDSSESREKSNKRQHLLAMISLAEERSRERAERSETGATGKKHKRRSDPQSESVRMEPAARFWLGSLASRLPLALDDNDFRYADPAKAALGRLLFYDRILSGNRNIACATCHHESFASADGVSLGVGEGGVGVGTERVIARERKILKHRVPRHSPSLFNLGSYEFTTMFHDGRVSVAPDEAWGFDTPAREFLPTGLPSILAAQALFPMLSEVEMAGAIDSNDVASAVARRPDHGWQVIEKRLQGIDAYLPHFQRAWSSIRTAKDIGIEHVAHALDDFISTEWRASNSPFDAWLSGNAEALDDEQIAGAELFYGKARCSSCHSGALQTDHDFHALMLPAIGPGRTRAFDPVGRDAGRMNVTDRLEDAYRFRTPSLRNVAHTAPYGHNGSFSTLQGIIHHHLDPVASLATWDSAQLVMLDNEHFSATDFLIAEDAREMARYAKHLDITPLSLETREIEQLVAFLRSLTDVDSIAGLTGQPESVPSGLPVD